LSDSFDKSKASLTAGVRIIFIACAENASILVCSAVSFNERYRRSTAFKKALRLSTEACETVLGKLKSVT
jgi:hypothetical protein